LTRDAAGNLYGTLGLADLDVFRLNPSGGTWSLTGFSGWGQNGCTGTVVVDANGNVFTTATGGGTFGKGVIFEITP
jgi:hypothetical protein